ncbi:putative transposase Ptta/En/Spm plant [Arabidopsis thaliana x Arabidopsis arenosa]|nr:putative transposase Ptta/En/Spm plant [Arabidopsis thaliana x Arabidopsis arenosa]
MYYGRGDGRGNGRGGGSRDGRGGGSGDGRGIGGGYRGRGIIPAAFMGRGRGSGNHGQMSIDALLAQEARKLMSALHPDRLAGALLKLRRRARQPLPNRLSDHNGFGPHRHTAGVRSYEQLRNIIKEGVEPSMLCILRKTHRKADGTYVDDKAKAFDEGIQRQLDEIEISRNSSGPSATDDSTNSTGLTRLDEDNIYYKVIAPQNGRIFGVGDISTRERGESSTAVALGRVTLERQVITLQEQLASVVEYMKQYMPNGAPNFGSTQHTEGTDTSVTSLDRANNIENEHTDRDQDDDIKPFNPLNEDADEDLDGEDEAGSAAF